MSDETAAVAEIDPYHIPDELLLPYNILFFDTETTGLPKRSKPVDHPKQPHITELGAILDIRGREAVVLDTLIYPDNWPFREDEKGKITDRLIDPIASEITGITEEMCYDKGIPIADALEAYMIMAGNADFIVCHNFAFDGPQMEMEYHRLIAKDRPKLEAGEQVAIDTSLVHVGRPGLCTMNILTPVLKLPHKSKRAGFKWPKLEEAWRYFYGTEMQKAHSAIHDIRNTRAIFYECVKMGLFDEAFDLIDEAKAQAAAA